MKHPKINKLACIFAHPDDEAFGPGGSIAYFARQGSEVTIISVTSGDADERFSGKVNGTELGKIRREELRKSAEILGVKKVIFLDFKDGDLNNNNYHAVTTKLKKELDKIKPDALMTFNLDGVSGHLDHVAVAMECSYLYERLRYVKTILYFCNDREEKKLIGKNYFVYFPHGIDKSQADLVITLGDLFEVKKKSMYIHKSQRKDALWLLTIFRNYLKEELFKVKTK